MDALLAPACLGHRGNTGRGKPPPPTVSSVQYACSVAVLEWAAPAHSAAQEGGGVEATVFGGGGGKVGNLKGVQGLWGPP